MISAKQNQISLKCHIFQFFKNDLQSFIKELLLFFDESKSLIIFVFSLKELKTKPIDTYKLKNYLT